MPIKFLNTVAVDTDVLYVDAGSNNVGIGTTSPAYKLDVDGQIRGEQYLYLKDTGGTNRFSIRAESTYGTIDNGSNTLNYNANNHLFLVGLSEKMRINSSGNVGIGTTSPGTKLDVVTANNTVGIQLQNSDGNSTVRLRNAGSPSRGEIYLDDNGSNTVLFAALGNSYINSGGNFGIGTTSPGAKLDVVSGDIRLGTNATYFRVRDTASAQPRVLGMNASNTTYVGPIDSYAGGGIVYGASGNVAHHDFYGGGSSKVRITSAGNVGIGTTSPATKLHISDATTPEFRIEDTTNNRYLSLYQNDANSYVQSSLNSALVFSTHGGNERMRITTAGDVGIGTTSPARKLEVYNGSSSLISQFRSGSGTSSFICFANTGSTADQVRIGSISSSLVLSTNYTERMRIDSSGKVGIGTTSPSYNLDIQAESPAIRIRDISDANSFLVGADNSGGYLGMFTNDSLRVYTNSSERMRIDSSGNVGIGTTSPDYKLEVNGTLGVSRTDGIIFAGSAGTGTGSKIVSNTSNDLIFSTALASTPYTITERVRILNNGNVGIGTTSPGGKLHVLDTTPTVKIQSNNFYPGAGISFTNSADNLVSSIYSYSNPGGSGLDLSYENYGTTSFSSKIQLKNGFMYFWTAGSIRAAITTTGNVGIGLTNPSQKLHVNGSGIISGNLGVGTTSPGEKLEVNGTIKATASTDAYKGYIKNTITCTPLMKSANTSYNYIPYNSTIFSSTPDYFNRMVTPYDGRVKKIILRHISGTTPTATGMKFKKEVNGTVSVTEYTATVTGGASASFTAIYNFANSDFTFSEGDSIGILAQTSGGTGNIGGASAQIIVEYNIT